ncbi:glycerophosphoryl diester phosphodiesterase [Sorangium cellulosum]|uniref:Glycerophosphoryl diester phosphodiesterase n=1 Tax=Sorangium cellulosum TaxID=56 RepID=A0A4P2Q4M0_SORCE|nr:glycerophosphodiester phosphodiesterase family protein [Sorangium cellulosum]AUX24315.1 glycerophosphoryl diester phosphodiesterase [Sorangium cellulosum]
MTWAELRFRRGAGAPGPAAPRGSTGRAGARAPLLIGHRGVRGEGAPPENTLAAFEEAAAQGADAIELDVRVCGSGEVVALHDPDLARVTGGADPRAAAALPWDELRRVDLGGERVPLLAEALAFARGRRLAVNVEMKRDVPDRAAVVLATARLLRAWDPRHAVLVSSFDPVMLASFGLMAPAVPRALLVHRSRYHDAAVRLPPVLGSFAAHIERTIASPERIALLQRAGRVVNVWTVNDPGEARDLAALGVDGLITDAPRRIRDALA